MRASRRRFLQAGGPATFAAACRTAGTPAPRVPFLGTREFNKASVAAAV